jgi:hypothetical protein
MSKARLSFVFATLAVASSTVFADLQTRLELSRRADEIKSQVSAQVDVRLRNVWVREVQIDGQPAYQFSLSTPYYITGANSYRGVVVVSEVTPQNIDEKIREVVAIVVGEIRERRETVRQAGVANRQVVGLENSTDSVRPVTQVDIGYPYHVNVWVQLPGADDEHETSWTDIRSQWMRTSIRGGAGLAGRPEVEGNPVVVGGADVTIYQLRFAGQPTPQTGGNGQDAMFLVRAGRVGVDVAGGNDISPEVRLDLEIGEIAYRSTLPASSVVRVYFGISIAAGLRVLESNEVIAEFLQRTSAELGILIDNQVFIQADAFGEVTHGDSATGQDFFAFGAVVGWRIAPQILVRAAFRYRLDQDPDFDIMNTLPEGPSVSGGVLFTW